METADLAHVLQLISHLGRLGLRGSEQGLLRTLLLEATPVAAEQAAPAEGRVWALPALPHDLDHRWSWAKLGTVTGYCKRAMQYAGARLVELGLLVKDGAVDPARAWCPNRYLLRVEVLEERAAEGLRREREQRLERIRGFGGGEAPRSSATPTSPSSSPLPMVSAPIPEGPEPELVGWARAQAQALLAARGRPAWVSRLTDEQGDDLAEIALAFVALLNRHRGPAWWWETAGGWAGPLKVCWTSADRPDAGWVQRLAMVLAAWRAGALARMVQDRGRAIGWRAREVDLNGLLRPRAFRLALERAATWWEAYQASAERERYEQARAAVQEHLAELLEPAWRALEDVPERSPGSSPAPKVWLGWRALLEAQLKDAQPQDLERRLQAELLGELLDSSQRLGREPGLERLRAVLTAAHTLAGELGLAAAQRPPPGLGPPTQGPPAG